MEEYLLLDTNIYLSILKGDLESAHFDVLKKIENLLDTRAELKLLVPEIIKVEFENNYKKAYQDHIDDLKKGISQIKNWPIYGENCGALYGEEDPCY